MSPSPTIRRLRLTAALIAPLALVLTSLCSPVVAGSAAPPAVSRVEGRWTVSHDGGGQVVTWHAPARLPVGGAAPEFRIGDRVIGYPAVSADLRSLSLHLSATSTVDLAAIQAWVSGVRLDRRARAGNAPTLRPYLPATPHRAIKVDPGARGPWSTTSSSYALDPVMVPDLPLAVPTIGHVVAPADAPGPRPLVLFLHGRHPSCYVPGTDDIQLVWPCPDGWKPIPSYLGYRYLQRLLASQGYVTVSIAANAIDGQETFDAPDFGASARAALVRHHLSVWADWARDPGSPWVGRIDMDAVTLVGHSRGGEGVNRLGVVASATDDYTIDGLVLIAPTDFGRQAAPAVPTVTLLGYCDGDVTDLEGQGYVDVGRDFVGDTSVRSSVLVMGANHNYFNTEWTPGLATAFAEDDWREPKDPVCGTDRPTRLSAEAQRRVASTYVAGAVRLVARRDGRVLPMFDGSRVRVPSAGDVDVRSSAVGGQRRLVAVTGRTEVSTSGPVEARLCVGKSSGPEGVCGEGLQPERTPHWPRGDQPPYRPGQPALEISWSGAEGSAELNLAKPLDLSGSRSVDARVIVDTSTRAVRVALRLTDADGNMVLLTPRGEGVLHAFPGSDPLGKLLAQTLRASLLDVAGIDLSRIIHVGLVSRSEQGRVWLLDVAGRSPGLAPPTRSDIPVLRLLNVHQREGSSSDPQSVDVTVVLQGELARPTLIAVRALDPSEGSLLARTTVRMEPGQSSATFAVPFERDDRDDSPSTFGFDAFAFATSGQLVTGDYAGRVVLRDDDAAPAVTFRRIAGTVPEGSPMRWQVQLSEPVDYFAGFSWTIVKPREGVPALRSDDVPASWLRDHGVEPPPSPLPLWRLQDLGGFVFLEPGQTAASLRIPTVVDARRESRELVPLHLDGELLEPRPSTRSVGVRDGA